MRIETFARKSHMERTRAESLVFVVASTLIALATLFAVTWAAGFDRVAARLQATQPIWFLVALGAEAVAYVGYVLSYREVSRVEEGPSMNARTALAAVTAVSANPAFERIAQHIAQHLPLPFEITRFAADVI